MYSKADNGGIKESFRAYQHWAAKNGPEQLLLGLKFTQTQLFFINYGQIWCGLSRSETLLTGILSSHHSLGEFRYDQVNKE